MASAIVLIRHGPPEIDRSVPSEQWRLDPAALNDVTRMVEALPVPLERQVFHSPEPRAVATAEVLRGVRGLQLVTDARLREAERDGGWIEDYERVAESYLRGERLPGWEPQADVLRRIGAAVDEAASTREGTVALVTHGLAMTVYLASRVELDPAAFWRGLSLPDAWRLGRTDGSLTRLVRIPSALR